MNILIDGAGSIGIALGASMVSENIRVSFFAKGKTAEEMKEKGIKRVGIFKHIFCSSDEYNVYTDYEDIPRNIFDYVFICSKTIANDEISSNLNNHKDIFKKDGKIIIFQNGYGNDEPYLKYFSKDQVYCSRVITGFMRPERNISEITVHTAPLLLGSLQGASVESLKSIAKLINDSGIPSGTTENLSEYLWAKMLYNCTLNPLGAILDVRYGKLAENEYSINIMNKLIEEIFNVMNAAGFKTLWSSAEDYRQEFYSRLVPDTYDHVSSTAQDIQKKKKTEIDTLNGKVILMGEEYGVDVIVNKIIYDLIKSIEVNF